ncbi:MAG: hypothetical protein JWM74_5709 [Myxococcaceae bacterium]|nr:hypothetical protein [Myxococcaceae bacterium]
MSKPKTSTKPKEPATMSAKTKAELAQHAKEVAAENERLGLAATGEHPAAE